MRGKPAIDEAGKRYGALSVVALSEVKYRAARKWLCVCDCGRQVHIVGTNLRKGNTKSCGVCGSGLLPGDEAAFRQLLNQYRTQARKRGLSFELSRDQFRTLTSGSCHYCGSPPAYIYKPSRDRDGADPYIYNGVDRMNNDLGYIAGNVATCCGVCNGAKSTMSSDQFLALVAKVARHSNLLYKD